METSPPHLYDKSASSSSTRLKTCHVSSSMIKIRQFGSSPTATPSPPSSSSSSSTSSSSTTITSATTTTTSTTTSILPPPPPPPPPPPSASLAPPLPPSASHDPRHIGELAELSSSEVSLNLQDLIDEHRFTDGNLFDDLIDSNKNEMTSSNGYNGGLQQTTLTQGASGTGGGARTSPTESLGSSGHSSPTGVSDAYSYRPTLAYLPGSVHNGSTYTQMSNPHQHHPQHHHPQQQQQHHLHQQHHHHHQQQQQQQQQQQAHHQHNVQVKQEPLDTGEFTQQYSNNNSQQYSNGTVSSTTPSPPNIYNTPSPSSSTVATPLKSFVAQTPKYIHNNNNNNLSPLKKKGERCNDEYRRRRERNNVAVRKSREKAKIRTRETEERVKILARENERLLKKVELLQEELTVLRSLFSNVGVLPDHIHRELSKHMDNFQQQHNAMGTV